MIIKRAYKCYIESDDVIKLIVTTIGSGAEILVQNNPLIRKISKQIKVKQGQAKQSNMMQFKANYSNTNQSIVKHNQQNIKKHQIILKKVTVSRYH